MRIAIMGTGGVGGYFGGRLAAAGREVTFIARGAQLDALRSRGLRIASPKGDLHLAKVRVADSPAAIGPVDIVFFTVKMYQTEAAAAALGPLLGPNTGVVTFQNGVDSADMLSRAIGRAHVIGGVAYVAAVIVEPGLILHTAMDRLIFGELDGTISDRVTALAEACRETGFESEVSDRIEADIWEKFVRLSVFSGLTSVVRAPIGTVRSDPDLVTMVTAALDESIAVGRAKAVGFKPDLLAEIMAMMHGMPAHAKSSMLEDLERGKPLELPWLSGAVVRIGREVGVATPLHQFIATVLKPHVMGRV